DQALPIGICDVDSRALQRGHPIRNSVLAQQVVCIQILDEFTTRQGRTSVSRATGAAVGSAISSQSVGIGADQFCRSVLRAVIDYEHLAGRVPLREGAFKRLSKKPLAIVARNNDGNDAGLRQFLEFKRHSGSSLQARGRAPPCHPLRPTLSSLDQYPDAVG